MLNNLPLLVLWAVLILLVVVRSGRRLVGWGILLPTAVVQAAAVLLQRVHLYLPPELLALIVQVMTSLVLGLAILWVLADRFSNRRAFLGGAVVLFILIAGSVVVWKAQRNLSYEMAAAAFVYAVTIPALLIGLTLTIYFCRRQSSVWRFALWLLFWLVVLCAAGSTVVTTGTLLIEPPAPDEWFGIAVTATVLGSSLGEILFISLAPLLVLAAVSPFYRWRLTAYLDPDKSGLENHE